MHRICFWITLCLLKKAQHHHLSGCVIQIILTCNITIWYRNWKKSQTGKTARSIMGHASKNIYIEHLIKKACCTPLMDCLHSSPLKKRLQSMLARTNRIMNSYFPQAIRLLNRLFWCSPHLISLHITPLCYSVYSTHGNVLVPVVFSVYCIFYLLYSVCVV